MSLSMCKVEVHATNKCTKDALHVRLLLEPLEGATASTPIPIKNDNHACVSWSKSTTTKGMKHLNLRDNFVREAVALKDVVVSHIAGRLNKADLFTKELRDGAHFRTIRDSFMRPHIRAQIRPQ